MYVTTLWIHNVVTWPRLMLRVELRWPDHPRPHVEIVTEEYRLTWPLKVAELVAADILHLVAEYRAAQRRGQVRSVSRQRLRP